MRRRELLEAVSPPLLQHLCDNAGAMAMDKACSVVVSDILGAATGDLRPAMQAVADLAAEELTPGGVKGQVRPGVGSVFGVRSLGFNHSSVLILLFLIFVLPINQEYCFFFQTLNVFWGE